MVKELASVVVVPAGASQRFFFASLKKRRWLTIKRQKCPLFNAWAELIFFLLSGFRL